MKKLSFFHTPLLCICPLTALKRKSGRLARSDGRFRAACSAWELVGDFVSPLYPLPLRPLYHTFYKL